MADEAAQGVAAYNARAQEIREAGAYNALNRIYGPIAGDPVRAQQSQNYLASTQQDPLKTQGLELANQGAALQNTGQGLSNDAATRTNAQNAGTDARGAQLRAVQLLQGAPPEQRGDLYDKLVAPHAADWGIDPAHVGPTRDLITGDSGDATLTHLQQALSGGTAGANQLSGNVSYGTDANGQPVEILHTKSGQTIMRPLGATPTIVTNAGSGATRAATGQANAVTGAFRANTTANNSEFGSGGAPAPTGTAPTKPTGGASPAAIDAFIKAHGGADAAIAAAPNDAAARAIADRASALATAKPNPIPPTSLYATLPPKGRQEAIGGAQSLLNQKTTLGTINSLLDTSLKQVGPFTSGAFSTLNALPGTAATDLKANLASLKAQGLLTFINSLKNAKGQTGIGRVLQSEANAATNLYGNMEQDQSPAQLAYHMRLFRGTVNDLYNHARQGYSAFYGVQPEAVLGTNPDTGAPHTYTPAQQSVLSKYGVK